MFCGLDFCQDEDSLVYDTINIVNNFYRLEIADAKFDEIHVFDNANKTYSTVKTLWDYMSLLLARFQNNLEAGSVDIGGIPIEYVLFRKRKIDELVWQDVAVIPYDPYIKIYEFLDRLVQSTEIYEYQCVPLTATVVGKPISTTVECDFDGTWITEKDDQYQLLYNLEMGELENVTETSILQPMTQYPVIVSSPVDYVQGNIKSLVLSEATATTGQINKRQERLNREKLLKFLKNRKPKILRDSAGRYYLISVIGKPKEIPNNDLQGSIAEINFQFIEIGNAFDGKTLEQSTFTFTPSQLTDGGNYNAYTPNLDTNNGYDGGDF